MSFLEAIFIQKTPQGSLVLYCDDLLEEVIVSV